VSSEKRARCTPIVWGVSFIYILNSVGDRTEPCGTPALIILGVDISPSTKTENFLLERKEIMSLIKLDEKSIFDNLYNKPLCHVVSNAYSIFMNTAAIDMLLKLRVTSSFSLIHCKVVLGVHGIQTDLHLAGLFRQCAFRQFLE
jgi:hypothetical protein